MGLFQTSRGLNGWRAVVIDGDALRAVDVGNAGSAKRQVTMAASLPLAGTSPTAVLEGLAREWQGGRYRCTTVLSRTEYQFLPVEAPNVPPTELKSAVSWLIRDMLDFHVDEATIDVLTIPQDKSGVQRNQTLYAVATRSRLIEERQAWFRQAKIPLRVIDIPEMAQRNIAALLEPPDRGLALLSFDSDGGLLTLTAGGELYVARRIDVQLGQILTEDAEQKEALFGKIALELQRSLDHFIRQYRSVAVARLLIAPLADADSGLQAYLAENVETAVECLDLESVFDFSTMPHLRSPGMQQQYWMALGAALRHEEKVL